MIYGRIGVDIASAIVDSIMPWQVSWTLEKGLLSQYHSIVNQSQQVASYPRKCLAKFLVNQKLASEEVAVLTSLSTFKLLSALRIAHTVSKYVVTQYN